MCETGVGARLSDSYLLYTMRYQPRKALRSIVENTQRDNWQMLTFVISELFRAGGISSMDARGIIFGLVQCSGFVCKDDVMETLSCLTD